LRLAALYIPEVSRKPSDGNVSDAVGPGAMWPRQGAMYKKLHTILLKKIALALELYL
jgi:hypothetical protein